MKKDIKCRNEWWDVNEYNERLSKENDITEESNRRIKEIKKERDKNIDKVWERQNG